MRNSLIVNIGFLLLGLLFFIWPIPGTITIRDISIFLLFGMFAYSSYRSGPILQGTKKLDTPFLILAVLTAWIMLSALFFSKETVWSLKEIEGQWLISVVVFITAAFAGNSAEEGTFFRSGNIMTLLFSVLMVHILYVDIYAIYVYAKTDVLPIWVFGLTHGKSISSYLSHFLLMILCVEIYFRSRHGKGHLTINNSLLFLAMLLTLFSIYLEAVRNGTVEAVLLLFVFILLYFSGNYKNMKKLAIMSSMIIILLIFGYLSSTSPGSEQRSRWKSFLETVPLALDTQHNKAWLDRDKYPYPKLKSGEPVAGSNYERIAWFKEGVVLIIENPLGVGFGRNAFGHALKWKYPEEHIGGFHSHSGILDFSIGTGVPGFLLWMLFIISLMYRSLTIYRNQKSYFALLLFFVTLNFTLRSVVDSNIRDHMLQMFMFLAGLLYVLMLREKNECA
ncbi:MAG: O-antigen ligase family protein [Nitrospirae bacterium]|nr:O-antigen ligase family protein [Nitrospirota bacterium]